MENIKTVKSTHPGELNREDLLPETGASTIITSYFVIIYRRKFDLVNILHNLFLDKSIKFANLNTYHDCLFFSRQKTACMHSKVLNSTGPLPGKL